MDVKIGKGSWKKVTEQAAWSRRDSMRVTVFEGALWLTGGYTPKRVNDVWRSRNGKDWMKVTEAASWPARNLHGATAFNGRLWILGGGGQLEDDKLFSYNDVWSSRDGSDWHLEVPSAPWNPRTAFTLLVFKRRLWILGGFDASNFKHKNDVWVTCNGKDWELVTSCAEWPPRGMHTSVVFDDAMWVFGGGVYDPSYPKNTVIDYSDVWRSEDGVEWRRLTEDAGWLPRRFHCSIVYEDKIWLLAGYHYGNLNDVWCSDNGEDWIKVYEGAPWARRHAPACIVFNDLMWLMGGFGDVLFNDIWVYEEK